MALYEVNHVKQEEKHRELGRKKEREREREREEKEEVEREREMESIRV